MNSLTRRYHNVAAELETALRKNRIPAEEAEHILEDFESNLESHGLGELGETGQRQTFFQKPLRRRIQIVLEAFFTAVAMAILFSVALWKLIN